MNIPPNLKILHVRDYDPWALPPEAVYVGSRKGGWPRSAWRNPYKERDHGRTGAFEQFKAYAHDRLHKDPTWLDPLRGKSLICWCSPVEGPCHCQTLLQLANGLTEEEADAIYHHRLLWKGPANWVRGGREYTGFILLHAGLDPIYYESEERASRELRASMAEDARRQEREVWDAFVEADRAYLRSRLGLGWRGFREHERLRKRKSGIHMKYRRLCWPERFPPLPKRDPVSQGVRRAVIAEWEASGRVCAICGGVVGADEAFHVHHITPASQGGTSDAENVCVAHASCNVWLNAAEISWTLSWKRRQGNCAVCGQSTNGVGWLCFNGHKHICVYLCKVHKTYDTVRALISVKEAIRPRYARDD